MTIIDSDSAEAWLTVEERNPDFLADGASLVLAVELFSRTPTYDSCPSSTP